MIPAKLMFKFDFINSKRFPVIILYVLSYFPLYKGLLKYIIICWFSP